MRVMAATRRDAASYYRITAPFSLLKYRGVDVTIGIPVVSEAQEYDVLWLQQHADPEAELLARVYHDAGKLVVYDVDDWLFDLPPSWPSYDHFFNRGTGQPTARLHYHERLIRMADLVTTTTGYLAGKLRTRFPDNQVEILPNYVMAGDWEMLPRERHTLDGPVLMWFGTTNHWDDLCEIAPAIDRALAEVNGHFGLIGAPELAIGFPARLRARTLLHPLVSMERFAETRLLICTGDVGLAWVSDRLESSRCRSPLKTLQYGAAGIPLVASETVYGDLREDLFFLTDLMRLEDTLVSALVQRDQGLARAWQAKVYSEYSYETQACRWLDVLNRLLS